MISTLALLKSLFSTLSSIYCYWLVSLFKVVCVQVFKALPRFCETGNDALADRCGAGVDLQHYATLVLKTSLDRNLAP